MAYTFFDFDGTLTRQDSFICFIRHVRGLVGLLRSLAVSLPAIALWKVGLRTGEYAKLRLFSAAFRGMSHEEFRSAGESFARKVEGITRSETVAALGNALREHRTVAIVSASCGDWIAPGPKGTVCVMYLPRRLRWMAPVVLQAGSQHLIAVERRR